MVTIDNTKCIGCGACARDCVAGNIALRDGKAERKGPCILCGHCVAICPAGAASIPSYDMADVEACGKAAFDIGEFLRTVKARRSIRDYQNTPVAKEALEALLQAGRYTATGSNRQACRFVVVRDALHTLKSLIWEGVDTAREAAIPPPMALDALKNFSKMRAEGIDYLFRNAPALIYVAAESAVDAALAAQNMEMAAVAQGLGILYNGFLVYAANMNPEARAWLGIEDKPAQVCMLVGHPNMRYERTAPRRAADARWL